jgi:hypothetical protein
VSGDGELSSGIPGPTARRRRWLLLAAAGGIAVAVVIPLARTGGEPTAPSAPTTDATWQAVPSADVFAGPARGSLAGDTAFLDAVLRLAWTDPEGQMRGLPDPPLDTRRVAYASDVPGGRWVLVVGSNTGLPPAAGGVAGGPAAGDLAAAWFTGPVGSPAADLALSNYPYGISPSLPMALWDPAAGQLVVVAAPGDVVEVSERPRIDAEGVASRSYLPVDTDDGVAVLRLPPAQVPFGGAVSYRVLRDGALVVRSWPEQVVRPDPPSAPPPPVVYPRGTPSAPAQEAAAGAVSDVLAVTGLRESEVRAVALWGGEVAGVPGSGALVLVELPSGAVVVTARWQLTVPDGPVWADCGQAIEPAGPAPERRLYAGRCEIFDPTGSSPVQNLLFVVAPRDVAAVRVYGADDVFLAELPTADGVLAAPLPRGTMTVEGVTSGGVGRGRVELLGHRTTFGN